jgi:hypothetical protein
MIMSAINKRKLSVPEVAKQWGVSSAKVLKFIRTGELRAINLASHTSNRPRYAVDTADVEAFERGRQVVPIGNESSTRLRRRAAASVKEFF